MSLFQSGGLITNGIVEGKYLNLISTQTYPTPNPSQIWINSISADSLGLLCAVGQGATDRIMTSQDGTVWTAQTSPHSNELYSEVEWSPFLGLFVIANSGWPTVSFSYYGTSWSETTSIGMIPVDIVWSPTIKRFVVVNHEKFSYSPSGDSNWTTAAFTTAVSSPGEGTCICWSPEAAIYCVIGGARSAQSNSGLAFNISAPHNLGTDVDDICWSAPNGIFLAVFHSGTIAYSTDGDTWTGYTETTNVLTACEWSDTLNKFVVIANTGTQRIMTSTTGRPGTWSYYVAPEVEGWDGLCWSEYLGKFVAVSATPGQNQVMLIS